MLFGLDAIPLTEPRAGVGHYTFELARSLALASPSDEFELSYPSSFPPVILPEVGPNALPANLSLARVRVGALGRHWWSAGLPRYARRRRLALFHGTNFDVPLWGSARKVLTVHDLSLLTHPETHEARRVARARRRLPLMTRAADAIVTPTEAVRREVCELLHTPARKVFAVHEAARDIFRPLDARETEGARRRLGVGEEFILAVGTLEPRKNLAALVVAFGEVLRALGPEGRPQLVIAGGAGWKNAPLHAALDASPFKERVLLTGYLHDEDLRALYSSCRLFVYPSLYEGFGLPPLEAMSCGAPVVAGQTPAVAEVTGGAARLVRPDGGDDLARAILELLGDEHARRRLSEAGLRRASEFSWERTARMTLEVYREVLRQPAFEL